MEKDAMSIIMTSTFYSESEDQWKMCAKNKSYENTDEYFTRYVSLYFVKMIS